MLDSGEMALVEMDANHSIHSHDSDSQARYQVAKFNLNCKTSIIAKIYIFFIVKYNPNF